MKTEYLLERDLSGFSELAIPDEIRISRGRIRIGGKKAGVFKLLPYSDGTVYFYDFRILKPGRGTGTYVFPYILSFLSERYGKIRLQVSDSNTAAFKLYSKFGFTVIEEVHL